MDANLPAVIFQFVSKLKTKPAGLKDRPASESKVPLLRKRVEGVCESRVTETKDIVIGRVCQHDV